MKKLSRCLLSAIVVLALAVGMVHAELAQQNPMESLPWEEDSRFKEVVNENNTPILMAKYHATFDNPFPEEMYNVELAANRLAGTVVAPGEIFSQNQKLGPYTEARDYKEGPIYKGTQVTKACGGGVCKIASLLYNVAILCNLRIVERYNHSMAVPYVPPGQDATVYYGAKDLRFVNNTQGPIIIWAGMVHNTLHLAIYGQSKPPKVSWHHEILRRVEYWTIYRTNISLPEGAEKIVVSGQDGCLVRSWLTIEYEEGKVEEKYLGENWYNVMPQVIELGPKNNSQ